MTVSRTRPSASEAGFTLIEALVAVLVLVVGIQGVANLMVVASTSNSVANHSSAATAQATETLERLKALRFDQLVPGGNLDADVPGPCNGNSGGCFPGVPPAPLTNYSMFRDVPGVGQIRTRWLVRQAQTAATMMQITVRSESVAPLMGVRSRAEFTTYRSCTAAGCPF
jgi:type II secretory pathway pseudopilin PulG